MATKLVRTRLIISNLFDRVHGKCFIQRTNLTYFAKCKTGENVNSCKKFSLSAVASGTAGHAETTSTTQGLSKLQAQELVLRLTGDERTILMTALQEYQSKLIKDEYEGKRKQVFFLLSCIFFCLSCVMSVFTSCMYYSHAPFLLLFCKLAIRFI